MKKSYTPEEIEVLRKNGKTIPELASELNRSYYSVSKKIKGMGLKINYDRYPYKTSEIKYLRDNYGKVKLYKIAKHLKRRTDSIRRKARQMGLESLIRYYTPEERDYILENIGLIGYKQIAKKLNRSVKSIQWFCRKRHIKLMDNVFTIPILCEELGMKRNRLLYLMRLGYLKATRAPYIYVYGHKPVVFKEDDVKKAMQKRPDLFNLYKIENPYFKNMFREVLDGMSA